MRNTFLIIDPQRNTVRVPGNIDGMAQVIRTIKSEDIHVNDTQTELLNDVKAYLKESEHE